MFFVTFLLLAWSALLGSALSDPKMYIGDIPDDGIVCKCELPDTIDHLVNQPLKRDELFDAINGPGYAGKKMATGPPDEGGYTPWTMQVRDSTYLGSQSLIRLVSAKKYRFQECDLELGQRWHWTSEMA